jgi:serine phosphatase RsbU (regulator of sigma subunit)
MSLIRVRAVDFLNISPKQNEARNKKGEMLGKEPIINTIRKTASSDATQIIDAIFNTLDKFIGKVKIEDDIKSVIIKMQH